MVATWLKHIRYLAEEIGPRGSTTPGERRGAEYCLKTFEALGYEPFLDTFTSARSIFEPHLYSSAAFLLAFLLYPLFGFISAWFAALLTIAALASELLELSFIDNPLRSLVSKGQSQNALAVAEPTGSHKQDLVLIGHIDTQRTPIIFKSQQWVDRYNLFVNIAFASFAGQAVLYLLGALFGWPWVWPVSIISAVSALVLGALCIHADRTPYTAGANDNASAVGLVLSLAEQLAQQPLEHTRVWLVCTGCEETQHYGAIDFFERHRSELVNPRAIAFEMLGCSGPAWLTREGIVVPFHADPGMVKLAEDLASAHPEWCAYPVVIKGGNTEMADALRRGIPAITLTGMTRQNELPYWHQPTDTFDKMDPEVLGRAYDFCWTYVKEIDRQNSAAG